LDASKTGLRVKLPDFNKDRQQWGVKKPWYAWKLEQTKAPKNNSEKSIIKRQGGSQFILDALVEEGEKLRKEVLGDYKRLKVQFSEGDQDLSRPWNAAKAKAAQAKIQGIPGFAENLEDIKIHVEEAREEYLRAVAISKGSAVEGPSFRDGVYDKVASLFAKPPSFKGFVFFSDDDVQTLKASLASIKSLNFAFSVAFRDLCAIKARAAGNIALSRQFAQCITIPNNVTRILSQAFTGETST
jgi:RNA-dependent RNA polymerase